MPPAVVGAWGSDAHDMLVRELTEIEAFYASLLQTPYRNMVRFHRLFLADRDDKRKAHEKWRANTFIPYPYSGTRTKVAALSDIFNSSDPPIQAEGLTGEAEKKGRRIERLTTYMLDGNTWPLKLDMQLQDTVIQGTSFWKLIHMRRARRLRLHVTAEQTQAFEDAIEKAVAAGAGDPPADDPAAFEEWRNAVNAAQYGSVPQLPSEPENDYEEVVEYDGPVLQRVPIFDLRFDPMIEDFQNQPVVIHRVVKSRKWLDDRTGTGPGFLFDPAQVAAALSGWDGKQFSEFEESIAGMLGLSRFTGTDPIYKNAVELWECWRPGTAAPYCIVLNRKAIVNKRPDVMPFWHGMLPFLPLRNVAMGGRALGLSDFQQTERLYAHMNTMHDLLLDATLLAVLPMFARLRDVGLPEMQRFLRPGGMLDVANPDGVKQITKMDPTLQHAFAAIAGLKDNVDESNATQPNVRGGAATIGRVSATESQGRLNQALLRQKQSVLCLESELSGLVPMALMLWYQFAPQGMKVRAVGDPPGGDPFVEYTPQDFLWAVKMDFRFRGASKALNRDLSAQQLKDLLVTGTNLQLMLPQEGRKILAKIYETLGHKGVAAIFTEAGDAEIQQLRDLQMASVRAQAATVAAGAVQQKFAGQPTPSEVPVNESGGAPPDAQPAAA